MTLIQALSVFGTAIVPLLEVKGAIGLAKIHGMSASMAYLLAEFRFQKLMADLYKILADVAGIDLDMLTQG